MILVSTLVLMGFFADRSRWLETKKISARQAVIIGVMTSIAVAGRCAFFMLPQVKPTAAVVVIAGAALGKERGFIVGALSMFVSNCIFGHGPWTLWQMLAMGLIGYLSGVIFLKRKTGVCWVAIYGFFSVLILYGFIADFSGIMMLGQVTLEGVVALYLTAVPFNLIHAVSTVAFLFVGYEFMMKKMDRIQKKYGVFDFS